MLLLSVPGAPERESWCAPAPGGLPASVRRKGRRMSPRAHSLWLVATVCLTLVAADHTRFHETVLQSSPTVSVCAARPGAEAIAAGANADWWSAVCADLARREYEASVSAAGLQAPNRAQNLRTHFRAEGSRSRRVQAAVHRRGASFSPCGAAVGPGRWRSCRCRAGGGRGAGDVRAAGAH